MATHGVPEVPLSWRTLGPSKLSSLWLVEDLLLLLLLSLQYPTDSDEDSAGIGSELEEAARKFKADN